MFILSVSDLISWTPRPDTVLYCRYSLQNHAAVTLDVSSCFQFMLWSRDWDTILSYSAFIGFLWLWLSFCAVLWVVGVAKCKAYYLIEADWILSTYTPENESETFINMTGILFLTRVQLKMKMKLHENPFSKSNYFGRNRTPVIFSNSLLVSGVNKRLLFFKPLTRACTASVFTHLFPN